jgi:hypothetical protein
VSVQLNNTIVNVHDKAGSARTLAELPGLAEPTPYGPFLVVKGPRLRHAGSGRRGW